MADYMNRGKKKNKKSQKLDLVKMHKQVTKTPVTKLVTVPDEEKMAMIEPLFKEVLEILGLDLSDDSLAETPRRMAKMYVKEIFSGLKEENFPKITTIENKMNTSQMVLVKDINVMSTCEHHLITIAGFAHVAYIPKDKVIGLSKINRIVAYYSKRPQVQERLTIQIAEALRFILGTKDVAVHINAKHYCVAARGVQDVNSTTSTSELSGAFLDNLTTRSEFYALTGAQRR